MTSTQLTDKRRIAAVTALLAGLALLMGACVAPGARGNLPPSAPAATHVALTPEIALPSAAAIAPTRAVTVAAPAAVLAFSVNPTATLAVGDRIAVAWQAVGEQSDLCMISGPGPVDCQEVPLVGQQTVTVTEPMLAYSGIGLRATTGADIAWALADLRFACQAGAWFFADPPQRCPEAKPEQSAAAYQPFEQGFVIWTQTPDRFYVFFEQGNQAGQFLFADAPYDFLTEQSMTETPPAGLYAPVSGFGKLWRNELTWWRATDIRGELGWATAPEAAYDATRQCELPSYPGMWTCYVQTPDGRVLVTRPDSTAQVHFVWEWR